jgi:hypothetical protein
MQGCLVYSWLLPYWAGPVGCGQTRGATTGATHAQLLSRRAALTMGGAATNVTRRAEMATRGVVQAVKVVQDGIRLERVTCIGGNRAVASVRNRSSSYWPGVMIGRERLLRSRYE